MLSITRVISVVAKIVLWGTLLVCSSAIGFAQSKVNITSTLPGSIDICGASASVEIDVRNITTGNVSGISVQATLPSGIYYVKGSVSGNSVSEKSTTNLQKPEFDLPDLSITQNAKFTIDIIADCDLTAYLTNGGIPTVNILCTYSGGSVTHKSLPLSVNQPSINISSITKQYHSGSLGETFVRTISITNGGKGGVKGMTLKQTIGAGLKVVNIAGGSVSQTGNVYTSTIDTTHLKTIGDKDIYLDNGETYTVVDTLTIAACAGLSAPMTISWGCNGKVCATQTYNTQVSLINKAPNLVFTPSATLSNCFDNSVPSTSQLKVINVGDDTARNALISIFQTASTGFWGGNLSSFDTASLRMRRGLNGTPQKVTIVKTKLNLTSGILSCLGSNPIASMELSIPAILPGDTIYLDWESKSCSVQSCVGGVYAHRWNYSATYEDQCQKTITAAETRGSYGLYHNLNFTSFTPTDIVDKDTSKLILTVTTGSLVGVNAYSLLDIYCELPPGVAHSLNKKDFEFRTHAGAVWRPNTITMVGDSLHAQFKGAPTITLVRSDLIIKVFGDCSNASSNKTHNLNIDANFTPDTRCNNPAVFRSFCYTTPIKVHCDNSCNSGLKFSYFGVDRISYGLPDSDNDGIADATGSIDVDKIRTERVMYGDTLMAVFRGKVNRQGSITNWTRLTASSAIPYGQYLEVADARVRILRRGTQLYSCDQIKTSYSTTGNVRTFTFDLGVSNLIASSCPLYSGFTYTTTDSVELYVKYVVATNPGNFFREITVTSDFYLHNVASPASYQKYQCDSFSGNFQLVGSYFTNCCRGVYSANSCGEITVTQNYYLSVGNCCSNYHGGNMFPSEYRAWAKPNKLIIIPPAGFDVVHTRLYDYRTAGTGTYKYQYADTVKLSRQIGDTLEYDIGDYYEDKGGSFKISDDGFVGVWYCKLKPNCLAKHGSSPIQYGFEFQELGFLGNQKVRYYSKNHDDHVVYDKPQIGLTTLSDDVNADSDTAEWQLVIDNSSATSNSKNIWIAAADNGNTSVVSIIDIATGNAVPNVNGIFQLGDLDALKKKSFLLKATYLSCERDSFVIHIGNDCDGYPDSLSVARCVDSQRTLYYTPQNTLLSPSIVSQDTNIDLCAFSSFEVNVKNLSNARAFNVYVDLFLQPGVILKDTAYAFIEHALDSVMLINPINLGGGQYRWEVSKYSSYLQKEGLAGVTSNLANEFNLKCSFSTDCDYVSSTYFLSRPGGELRCGKAVLSNYAASKPIDIKGIVKPYFSFIEFDKKPIDVCNYDGDGQFRFINLGPDTTGSNDFIQLLLPDGIYVDTTYLVSVHNGPTSKPTVRKGLKYTGLWEIPSGIALGDSMIFKYRTYVDPAQLDCGSTQIIAQSVVLQPALCVKDSTYCDINVSTSNDLQLDSIKKGIYQIRVTNASSVAYSGGEMVSLNYEVTNTGSQKEPGILMQVKVVADTNGNGIADPGEAIIARDSITTTIANNQTIQDNMQFVALSKYVCNLLLVIDSTNCVCSQTYQPIGKIHLVNAGRDTTVCSRIPVTVGQTAMPDVTYKWLNATYVQDPDSSQTTFVAVNSTNKDLDYRLLLETDRGSCKSVDTAWITLHPAMFLDLQDTVDICQGERVIVGEVPTGGVGFKSYQWTPTDSLMRSTSVKTWANPTSTTLYSITITDAAYCEIKDSTLVVVHNVPTAVLSIQDTCVGIGYTIGHNSVLGDIGFDTIQYVFQNNDSFINTVPGFIPTSDSAFRIELFIQDSFGCTSFDTQFARPYPLPIADFSTIDVCQYGSVLASNTSQIKAGSLTYTWNVNNQTFNTTDLDYIESDVGQFEVELIAQSDKGCLDSHLDTIMVFEKPVLKITGSNECLGVRTQLNAIVSSTTNVTPTSFTWSLGDGNSIISTGDTSHVYAMAGSYDVTCMVNTADGCGDTALTQVVVNPNPSASFSIQDACLGDSVVLNETSSISAGSLTNPKWETGQGFTTGTPRSAVLFSTDGLHPIQLISVSDSGCVDTTVVKYAHVKYTEEPSLMVTGNCAESNVNFTIPVLEADSVTDVIWDFTTYQVSGSNSLNNQVFNSPGTYKVNTRINFVNGCSTDSTFSFVIDPKPVADFTWVTPCDDNLARFTSTSTTSSGSITTTDWDLDDGTNVSGNTVNHLYTALGTYNVQHIAINNFNCADTVTHDVLIDHIVKPQFDMNDICVYDTQIVAQRIQDLVTPISSYDWDLGNGQRVLNKDSFAYAYQQPGSYKVTMQVETNPNCLYSATKTIQVHDLPTAGFFMNPERADVVNSEVDFTSTAVDAVSYMYTFSHGYVTNEMDFTYRFPDTATYTVTQEVTNQYGCKDQYSASIIIDFVVNILIPNAFHPNNDNINNTFSPQGLGIGRYEMKVYNRWGEQVYFTEASEPWAADNAIPGAYFYLITVYDFQQVPHHFSGMVQLIR